MDLPIVKFGKYKDKPITELLKDTKYLEWCKSQKELVNKYPTIFNIILHQTLPTIDSPTPEHNKLQNMFLDDKNAIKLVEYVNDWKSKKHYSVKLSNTAIKRSKSFDGPNIDNIVFEGIYNWDVIFTSEHKVTVKYIYNELEYYSIKKEYEKLYHNFNYIDSDLMVMKIESTCSTYYIELKPTLGDEYPCVLRKMGTQIKLTEKEEDYEYPWQEFILLIGQFKAEHTTKEQLIQIFKQKQIRVLFMDDIYNK
jgi:hypothetical protein